jgi:MSHA biogenesis protein MshP
MSTRTSHQHGFAAIAAIFLVVLLAALGGFMLTFSNTQQLTAAQDLQGSRAYWAARAGLAWAVAKIVATPSACPTGAPTAVDGFAVTVTCTSSSYVDGATTVLIYRLDSRASLGTAGSRNYVERSVSAALEM